MKTFFRLLNAALAAALVASLTAGCGGMTVSFGDMEPLPGIGEWVAPESPIEVSTVSYRRDCGTQGETLRVSLLKTAADVQAWEAARNLNLLAAGKTLAEGQYALIELGSRGSVGDGFAVSRSGGRKGSTALIKITGLSYASGGAGEEPTSPCALVALPGGRDWERVRVLDQVSNMQADSKRSADL